MFIPLRDLLPDAARKVHLGPQVKAGLVCARARAVIVENFPDFAGVWQVRKFKGKRLTIVAKNPSAASNLQMRKETLMGHFRNDPELRVVGEIKIQNLPSA